MNGYIEIEGNCRKCEHPINTHKEKEMPFSRCITCWDLFDTAEEKNNVNCFDAEKLGLFCQIGDFECFEQVLYDARLKGEVNENE